MTRLEMRGSKRVIYCLDCGHIQAVHNFDGVIPSENTSTGCNYVHYIENIGASVCKCHKFKEKGEKKPKHSSVFWLDVGTQL